MSVGPLICLILRTCIGQYSNVLRGREGVLEADPHDIMARIDPTKIGTINQTMNENDVVIRLVSSFYNVAST